MQEHQKCLEFHIELIIFGRLIRQCCHVRFELVGQLQEIISIAQARENKISLLRNIHISRFEYRESSCS